MTRRDHTTEGAERGNHQVRSAGKGLHVYTISGSPRGWRVLLGLMIKQLDYRVTYLQLSAREHKSDDYLRLNPRGTVPTLVTETCTITDSLASLVWLDKTYSNAPLFGTDANEAARVWTTTRDVTRYFRGATRELLTPIFFGPTSPDPSTLTAAVEQTKREISVLESRLERTQAYFVGTRPTAADIVTYPELRLVERAIETHPKLMRELGFGTTVYRSVLLAQWRERMESFDGFAKTLPVHWS